MPNRRDVLKGAGALWMGGMTGLTLPNLASAATRDINYQISWFLTEAYIGEVVAVNKGYFAERGLNPTIVPGGPSVNAIQDVLGGQAEVCIGYAPQIMYAANKRLPIKCVAAIFQKAPLSFYSFADKNIKSIKDWKGLRVGANASGLPQVKAILAHHGLSIDDITFVQSGVPGLLQDQVDIVGAWPTNIAQIQSIVDNGGGYNAQSIWDNGLQFQSNYVIALQETIENDTEMLVNLVEAIDAGWLYAADNRDEALDILVSEVPALDRELAAQSVQLMFDSYIYTDETLEHGFGNVSADRWTRTLDTYKKLGEIRSDLTAEDVFDDRVLKAAKRTNR